MRKSHIQIVLLAFSVLLGLTTTKLAAQNFPPITGSHIIDAANILSDQTKRSLDLLLQADEDTSGNQILVVTISSLEGQDIETYANNAYNHYRVGQKGTDNGVLLLVAHQDRKVRIEVGYGLEGDLPDVLCNRIIQNDIIPYFKKGDFNSGVNNGVNSILQAIQGTYVAKDKPWDGSIPMWLPILIVFIIIGVIVLLGIINGKNGGGGFRGTRGGGYYGGYYGGGWSSGGSGWSGGGGGGWSGGGGGFSGGGGASGSW